MKKKIALLMALVMVFALLAACSNTQTPATSAAPASEAPQESAAAPESQEPAGPWDSEAGDYTADLRIAVSVNSNDVMRSTLSQLLEDMAAERGYVLDIANADGKADKQISDAEALLARDPDIFVLMANDPAGAVAIADAVKAKGIPLILHDFNVDSEDYTTLITLGTAKSGQISGEYLRDWLAADPDRVNSVGYLVGDYANSNTMPRFTEMVAAFPEMVVTAEAQANWTATEAVDYTEDWLQAYPEMSVFACQNDEMAIGVIQALQAAGKAEDPNVLVMGYNALEPSMIYIESGIMVSVAKDLGLEAKMIFDTCERVYRGESVPKLIENYADYIMLDKTNVADYKAQMGW
jgi:ABC-type sugar transport system substrate-binding protein